MTRAVSEDAAPRTANYAPKQLPEHPLAMRRGALLLAALAGAAQVLDSSGAASGGVLAAPTLRALLANKGDACAGEIATGNWCIGVDGTQGCCGGCCGCCDAGCDASPCYACGASNACAAGSAASARPPCAPTEAACGAALAEINSAGGCARAVCKERTQYFSASGGGRGAPRKTACFRCGDAPCACHPGCGACEWTGAGEPATCDGAFAERGAALSSKHDLGGAKTAESYGECCRRCQDAAKCQGFTWGEGGRTCQLSRRKVFEGGSGAGRLGQAPLRGSWVGLVN